MEVIALQGPSNMGKSYTINALYLHMLSNGYAQVIGNFQDLGSNNDFVDVLCKNGNILIGIVSRGDIGHLLQIDLQTLQSAGCDKVICTCRTSGTTVHAVQAYPKHRFIIKTRTTLVHQYRIVNHNDMLALYSLI